MIINCPPQSICSGNVSEKKILIFIKINYLLVTNQYNALKQITNIFLKRKTREEIFLKKNF